MKKEIIFILVFVFTINFLSAAYNISPSSFSSEIYSSTQYNITINNTDLGNHNITKVDITLPGNQIFISETNGTDSISSFSNTSSVLSWTNNTYLITSSKFNKNLKSFWFNSNSTSLTDGNFTITMSNSSGSSVTKNISVSISDTTNPSLSYNDPTPSDSSTLSQNFIPVNLTASDNFKIDTIISFIYDNESMIENSSSTTSPVLFNFTSLSDGIYYINATVNDTSGNEASTSTRTITLNSSSSSSTNSSTETCTSSWDCGEWSQCAGGTQIRTCVDSNSCGDNSTKPDEERNCETTCTANWDCSDWSPESCSDGETQTRTCTDINSCGDSSSKPSEERLCPEESNPVLFYSVTGGIFLIIIILGIVVFFFMRNKGNNESDSQGRGNKFPPKNPPGSPVTRKTFSKKRAIPRMPRLSSRRGPPQRKNFRFRR